jgi:hypothetical protein
VEYILKQETETGIWTSETFTAPNEHAVKQAVVAGFLQNSARWAERLDGTRIYGLDRKGKPL